MPGSIVHATNVNLLSGSGGAVTIPSTTAGNTLLAMVQDSNGNAVTAAASGLTFVAHTSALGWGVISCPLADNIVSGVTSVTFTPGGFDAVLGWIFEMSGLTSSSFDALGTIDKNAFNASPVSSGNVTTVAASTFVIAFFSDIQRTGGAYSGLTAGWTAGTSSNNTFYGSISESSQGTFSASAAYNGSGAEVDGLGFSLKVSGGATATNMLGILGVG